ncbi:Ni/Fe hydrogenase subunit alpha [Nitrosococcus oceani]|uniref:Ni/Fe hydrogenase subunit alpha n=1 Tax=Nitrosococcus oceani TaxID=1229 RepID=UPI0004E8D965|nr:Ni/Fe hydrogenase subunit alpha [Nitrosococcus oceani]KFI21622.1 dehydrogenase [Nitrosococcus oceani]
MNDGKKTKTIKVDYLARVEGEGSIYLKIHDGTLADVELKIFEPPRFFEGFLRGRKFSEAPDITARICGICPVAYQMSAVHAMENAFNVTVDGPLRELRRLLYCGEWISSHALHIYMLHAPDFLGYESAVHMAKDFPDIIEHGLQLKKMGGTIMSLLGGREVHPINIRVGGFYKVPTKAELQKIVPQLERARDIARKTVRWTAIFDFPAFEQNYTFVSLSHPDEYPMNEGRIRSNKGLDIAANEHADHFEEIHVRHTNALHCVMKNDNTAYHVGPMARYALNFDRLPDTIQAEAKLAGLDKICLNPFKSIIVRSIEVLYACEEALRIIRSYDVPDKPFVEIKPRAAIGYAATEAPRGILYHRYEVDNKEDILDCDIIPPTSQNQKMIEDDLRKFVPLYLDQPDEKLQWHAEQAIRNYDPCISCATHFLKLEVDRS